MFDGPAVVAFARRDRLLLVALDRTLTLGSASEPLADARLSVPVLQGITVSQRTTPHAQCQVHTLRCNHYKGPIMCAVVMYVAGQHHPCNVGRDSQTMFGKLVAFKY